MSKAPEPESPLPPTIVAFPDTLALAEDTARLLGGRAEPIAVHAFPDGESLVRIECEARPEAWIFRSLDHPNDKLVEVLFAADALRRQGVERVGLVAPYLGYMRQDRVFHPGESLSQQVVANLLGAAFDDLLTVEAHLHRIERLEQVYPCRAESLSAAGPIADWIARQAHGDLLVGPDSESEPWIRAIAEAAQLAWVVGDKKRHSDRAVEIELPDLPSGCRSAWVIDDIASSGATLEGVSRILIDRQLKDVGAILVHPLFEKGSLGRFERLGLGPIVSTNSIAHPTNAIALAPILADAIRARRLA